jgi:predicted amidohydrolase YtcJ
MKQWCLQRRVVACAVFAVFLPLAVAPVRGWGKSEAVDLILHGGKVLTIDPTFSIKSAIAVKDGKIVAVGGEEIASEYKATRTIDLRGRVLLPGFMDTHQHVIPQGRRDVELSTVTSIVELQSRVRAKARELGPGAWVTGMAWDEARFAEKRNPSRADLDAAAPENPVMLVRAGAHSAVFNSAALQLVGVTRATPQPADGLIEQSANGEPSGIIRESWETFAKAIPPLTWSELRESYIARLKDDLALGITSVMEATGSIDDEPVGAGGVAAPTATGTFRQVRDLYAALGAELPRMALYIEYPGAERLKAFRHRTGYGDEHVRLGPIGESVVDGGFTGPTAWTLVDYKGQPGFRGKGRYTDAQLQEMVDTSARLGWQLGLHAIGDAAIVQTVAAYAHSLEGIVGLAKDSRWFLCHFTVMPPEATMITMARDHIEIAQQPNFTYTLEDRYVATLDDWRTQHTNSVSTPWKKHGLFVAFGSDNLPIGPMVGLYTAVTRKGRSGQVYGAEEAISIRDALRMYTANGPYLTFEEKLKGTLEPGKLADMIVLDTDPLTSPPEALLTTHVDLTILGGKIVYERSLH